MSVEGLGIQEVLRQFLRLPRSWGISFRPIRLPEHDAREPGYLREALLAFTEAPRPSDRLQLEVDDGDEIDPVPRGRLRLVRDEPEEDK